MYIKCPKYWVPFLLPCDPPLDGDEPLDGDGEGGVDGGRHRHLGQGQQGGRAGGQDLNTAWSLSTIILIKCSVLCLVNFLLSFNLPRVKQSVRTCTTYLLMEYKLNLLYFVNSVNMQNF